MVSGAISSLILQKQPYTVQGVSLQWSFQAPYPTWASHAWERSAIAGSALIGCLMATCLLSLGSSIATILWTGSSLRCRIRLPFLQAIRDPSWSLLLLITLGVGLSLGPTICRNLEAAELARVPPRDYKLIVLPIQCYLALEFCLWGCRNRLYDEHEGCGNISLPRGRR